MISKLQANREASEKANCASCQAGTQHTPETRNNHPMMGHGCTKEWGWTHPLLQQEHESALAEQGEKK